MTYSSNCSPRKSKVLLSSTRMISLTRPFGDRFIILHSDRISVDQASLWKIIMIEVVGSFDGYLICKHLRKESDFDLDLEDEEQIDSNEHLLWISYICQWSIYWYHLASYNIKFVFGKPLLGFLFHWCRNYYRLT